MTFALALCAISVSTIRAQQATARIIGTVTDSQGAIIPGATVTVTNVATKVTNQLVTDKNGIFQALDLPIGAYYVSVEHQGFKNLITPPYTLEINQVQRLDLKMEVGEVSETVQVSAGASVVETVNATLGASVTSRPLVNLPLNGRNTADLALLQPGVTDPDPDDTGGTANAPQFNVAGGRSDSITYLLDGGLDNNLLSNGVVYFPNPDAVQEFRILTSNYTAEYGRNAGGIVSVVMKSGTNSIHGSAFDFVRNDALNANTFFNNLNGLPRDVLKRNQFGVTIGGPFEIPKLVNGKDRFFWFFSYEGQRLSQGIGSQTTTFTPAELAGDFSHSFNGGPDPNVVSFLQANPYFQPNSALAAKGIIDPSRISSVAQKFISNNLIPTAPNGFLASQAPGFNNFDDFSGRLDFNITANDRLSVTLAGVRNPQLRPYSVADVPGYPVEDNNHTYYLTASYTRTFSSTLLNEFRFTAQRANRLQSKPTVSLPTARDLGINVNSDNPTGPPDVYFASGLSLGFSYQGPTSLINNTFVWADTLSWIRGKHNWKFGFSFSPYQNNTVYDYIVNGLFQFDGPAELGGIGSGNDLADFLFGLPDYYLQYGAAPSNIRTKSTYAFAQDEWHATDRLTLTLGLRYEYSTPKRDLQGRSFSLVPGDQSQRFINAPTGLVFPGDPGAPDGANFPDKNDFAPRFGFAWSPWKDGKTSLRGGFGVFYDILKGEDNLQFNGQAPFFGYSELFMSPPASPITSEPNAFSDPFGNTGQANPFPSRPPARDINFADSGFLPFGGGSVYFVDPHLRTPYVYQYNLSLQREITKDMVAEVSYVGSSSHKLTALVDANPMILGTTNGAFDGLPRGTNFSLLYQFENIVNANFNSMEASLQKRVGDTPIGTTYFTLSYTWGHSIDNASGFQNRGYQVPAYNADQFRANSDFDVRQRIVFSGGWDLPFDRLWKSGPRRLTQGWSLYPIASYRTGFPLDIFAGFSTSSTSPGPSGAGDRDQVRANLVGHSVTTLNPRQPGNYYFNPNQFNNDFPSNAQVLADPSLRTYGTLPRNFFRGPGRSNFDLAIAKMTSIYGERAKLEFRAEFFNILNAVEFSNPVTSIESGTFGQILSTADPRIIQFALRLTF